MISSSSDNKVKLWNLVTGQCIRTHSDFIGFIYCETKLNKRQLVIGYDNSLKIWDLLSSK